MHEVEFEEARTAAEGVVHGERGLEGGRGGHRGAAPDVTVTVRVRVGVGVGGGEDLEADGTRGRDVLALPGRLQGNVGLEDAAFVVISIRS